jgi:3'-phosphoadenosine 5'-phosphosulfate sulfotransferase (PAPS reductase)/FAD synthetase
MRDPFKIDSPTCISFSGGRTSAYMLWRVLQSNGGLPAEAVVCFANTGKEDEATLRFVRDCSEQWGVPITWLEFHHAEDTATRFKVVDFETASRDGQPFESVIFDLRAHGYLPNPVTRFCTIEMKIRPVARYLRSIGMASTQKEAENMSWVGIRADEPRRVAKIADKSRMPLWAAGVTKETVGKFWRSHTFDLELPNNNGVTMHGNCDLCFLKPAAQVLSLIQEKPQRAVWWAEMERRCQSSGMTTGDGARFRKDRPSYAEMARYATEQIDMFDQAEEAVACFCGD